MKQSVTTTLLVVLMSMTGVNAIAYNLSVKNSDGVTIYYDNHGTELEVTNIVGLFDCYNVWDYFDDHDYLWYSGNVVIPESVECNGKEYRVTSIGDEAFAYCSGLTSVTIPNSVTSIGSYAFEGCSGLTSVTIPNSVTSIGRYAFSSCGLTSISIPYSVTTIGDGAFGACSDLTSIQVESGNMNYDSRNNCNAIIDSNNQLITGCKNTIIPNSVTSIGYSAFLGCTGLTSINIPSNVTSIDYYAFSECTGLTSINIPSKVTSIGSAAFQSCTGLTSIDIPSNVTSIGEHAFYQCTGLVYVSLHSNLTSIGKNAFGTCYSLTDVFCKAKSVPSADAYAFYRPENITLHIPHNTENAYRSTQPWNKFGSYSTLYDSDFQASEKCSKPTISIVDGKFVFSCETPNVQYYYNVSTPIGFSDKATVSGAWSISLPVTLNVFTFKNGYLPSEVATYVYPTLAGDVNNDGEVNVADHVKLSEIIMEQKK